MCQETHIASTIGNATDREHSRPVCGCKSAAPPDENVDHENLNPGKIDFSRDVKLDFNLDDGFVPTPSKHDDDRKCFLLTKSAFLGENSTISSTDKPMSTDPDPSTFDGSICQAVSSLSDPDPPSFDGGISQPPSDDDDIEVAAITTPPLIGTCGKERTAETRAGNSAVTWDDFQYLIGEIGEIKILIKEIRDGFRTFVRGEFSNDEKDLVESYTIRLEQWAADKSNTFLLGHGLLVGGEENTNDFKIITAGHVGLKCFKYWSDHPENGNHMKILFLDADSNKFGDIQCLLRADSLFITREYIRNQRQLDLCMFSVHDLQCGNQQLSTKGQIVHPFEWAAIDTLMGATVYGKSLTRMRGTSTPLQNGSRLLVNTTAISGCSGTPLFVEGGNGNIYLAALVQGTPYTKLHEFQDQNLAFSSFHADRFPATLFQVANKTVHQLADYIDWRDNKRALKARRKWYTITNIPKQLHWKNIYFQRISMKSDVSKVFLQSPTGRDLSDTLHCYTRDLCRLERESQF